MTLRPTLAAPALTLGIVLISSFLAAAETPRKKPKKDPVADAIHRFKTRDKTTPNEVSVVLGNDDEQPPTAVQVGDDSKPADASTAEGSPVMVTGKPQADIDPAATSASTPEPPQPTEEPPKPKLEEDLAVRVERVRSGNGTIDPAQIVLTAPFPHRPGLSRRAPSAPCRPLHHALRIARRVWCRRVCCPIARARPAWACRRCA